MIELPLLLVIPMAWLSGVGLFHVVHCIGKRAASINGKAALATDTKGTDA